MFSGSIVALVTPFDSSDHVDYRMVGELVEWHIAEGTNGILLCGTTGESPTLCSEEKALILKTAISVSRGRVPIIMGTGCNNTKASVLATRFAKAVGVDACLVVVPYYNKPNEQGIYHHFNEIAKVGLPLLCYHHPGRTGTELSIDLLSKITKMPSVVGVKESSGKPENVKNILTRSSTTVLSGDDPVTFDMLKYGACGVISVLANIVPKDWSDFISHFKNGDEEKALYFHKKYKPLLEVLFNEVNPQGIKYALSLMGRIQANYRLPLVNLSEENKKLIKAEMLKLNLI